MVHVFHKVSVWTLWVPLSVFFIFCQEQYKKSNEESYTLVIQLLIFWKMELSPHLQRAEKLSTVRFVSVKKYVSDMIPRLHKF